MAIYLSVKTLCVSRAGTVTHRAHFTFTGRGLPQTYIAVRTRALLPVAKATPVYMSEHDFTLTPPRSNGAVYFLLRCS